MPRKKIPINWKTVDLALEAGCDGTEIAGLLGIDSRTLYRAVEHKYKVHFDVYKAQKRSKGNALLRQVQFQKAMKGDTSMQIWLGKNRLGQTDRPVENDNHGEILKALNGIFEISKEKYDNS